MSDEKRRSSRSFGHHWVVPSRWNPFAFPEQQPTSQELRLARIYSIVQLPIGGWIFWKAWTEIWIPDGPVWGTLAIGTFTAFGLAIIAANIRQAWCGPNAADGSPNA